MRKRRKVKEDMQKIANKNSSCTIKIIAVKSIFYSRTLKTN